jgi:hypothetical protein
VTSRDRKGQRGVRNARHRPQPIWFSPEQGVTGEPGALKGASPVRGGAVGNVITTVWMWITRAGRLLHYSSAELRQIVVSDPFDRSETPRRLKLTELAEWLEALVA